MGVKKREVPPEPDPTPDTGPQTPCTEPVQVWRFADAPQGARNLLPADADRPEGRWVAILPADAVAGWKDDAFWPDRKVPQWAVGWERTQALANALDACADPWFFKLANGRIVVIGCA